MRNEEQSRRLFLARTGQYLSLTLAAPIFSFGQARISTDPFTLGVASGDPTPDGIVLWTRLAPV
jgi:alkaline phosphatase D